MPPEFKVTKEKLENIAYLSLKAKQAATACNVLLDTLNFHEGREYSVSGEAGAKDLFETMHYLYSELDAATMNFSSSLEKLKLDELVRFDEADTRGVKCEATTPLHKSI